MYTFLQCITCKKRFVFNFIVKFKMKPSLRYFSKNFIFNKNTLDTFKPKLNTFKLFKLKII